MTKKEVEFVKTILERIKNPDEQIAKAINFCDKDLKNFDSRKGQLRDQYEYDDIGPW